MKFNDLKAEIIKGINELYKKYLSPLNEEERRKLTAYFYILLTLVAVSFFGLFAISPTVNTITTLNKQYQDDTLVLNALEQKLANLNSLDQEYATIQNRLDQIYTAIPKQPDIPKLTRQLETLAAEDNVQVTNLRFSEIEIYPNSKSDPIFSYLFDISVSGNQIDINTFLSDFINFDRIIGIERLSAGKNQENRNTLSITGRAFFAPK